MRLIIILMSHTRRAIKRHLKAFRCTTYYWQVCLALFKPQIIQLLTTVWIAFGWFVSNLLILFDSSWWILTLNVIMILFLWVISNDLLWFSMNCYEFFWVIINWWELVGITRNYRDSVGTVQHHWDSAGVL